jgi:methionyl-tRNA formyltransferase
MKLCIISLNEPFYLRYYINDLFIHYKDNIDSIVLVSAKTPAESYQRYISRLHKMYGVKAFLWTATKYLTITMMDMFNCLFYRSKLSRVCDIAKSHGISTSHIKDINNSEFVSYIKRERVDVILSIACPQIFKKELLNAPQWGCINLHGGLIPEYRGVFSSFWVLMENDQFTGVTVHKMNNIIDGGEAYAREKIEIETNETVNSLLHKTTKIGIAVLIDVMSRILSGNEDSLEYDINSGKYRSYPQKKDLIRFLKSGKRFYNKMV